MLAVTTKQAAMALLHLEYVENMVLYFYAKKFKE